MNGEEVDGCDVFDVVLQERSPGLKWRLSATNSVLPDRGFSHVDAEQSKFIPDPWNAPSRVVARHSPDEFSDLKRDLRSSGSLRSGLPSPVEAEALVMTSDDCLGPVDDEAGTPVGPDRDSQIQRIRSHCRSRGRLLDR